MRSLSCLKYCNQRNSLSLDNYLGEAPMIISEKNNGTEWIEELEGDFIKNIKSSKREERIVANFQCFLFLETNEERH